MSSIAAPSALRGSRRLGGQAGSDDLDALIDGAAGAGGFKGLGGRYNRRNLLQFGVTGVDGMVFTRVDTTVAVDCTLRLEKVPADPRLGNLLGAILDGDADVDATRLFGELWQERVRRILIDHADDRELVQMKVSENHSPDTSGR